MNKYIKFLSIFLITVCLSFLVGCTTKDAVDINQREYILAIAIDKNPYVTQDNNLYKFTAEIPLVNTGDEEKRLVVTNNNNSIIGFYHNNILSTDKVVSDSLMQVIILGENLANDADAIKRLFDEIERSPQINRKVKIVVSKGDASEILGLKIENNPLVGRYINEFLIKLKKLNYQTTYSFDEAVLSLQKTSNALIPSVEIKDKKLTIDGAAVIKNYEIKDYINHNENGIISMLTQGVSTGMNNLVVNVNSVPVYMSYENVVVSEDVDLIDGKLAAKFYVTSYFNIDSYDMTKNNSSNSDFERVLCNKSHMLISDYTEKLINKLQTELKTDILGIQKDLIKYQNREYEKVKGNYEEIFENANIEVFYNIKINNSGMIK